MTQCNSSATGVVLTDGGRCSVIAVCQEYVLVVV